MCANLRRDLAGLFERNGVRHGGAHPERAFIEVRHELAADERNQQQGRAEDESRDHHGQSSGRSECPIQLPGVLRFIHSIGAVGLFAHALLEPVGSQHRNQRQREDQRADQRERHGLGHGMEQLSRRPAERVNRQITGEDDRNRIEDGAIDILGRRQDDFVAGCIPCPSRSASSR